MSMNRNVIETEWLNYVQEVLPSTLSPDSVQYRETKKAFYVGAGSLFSALMKIMSPEHEPTLADLKIMDGIHSELQGFLHSVSRAEPLKSGMGAEPLKSNGAEPLDSNGAEPLVSRGAEPLDHQGGGAPSVKSGAEPRDIRGGEHGEGTPGEGFNAGEGANGGADHQGVDGGPAPSHDPDALRRTMPPAGPSAGV